MDAWEAIVSGSTISVGNAWDHLQAQGGGETGTYIILADGLDVEMSANDVEAIVDQTAIDVAIDHAEITVEIDQSPMEVEI